MIVTTYNSLLRLYPARDRELFTQEMSSTFERSASEHRSRGLVAFLFFVLRESFDLLKGIAVAWTTRVQQRDYISDRTLTATAHNLETSCIPAEVEEAEQRIQLNLARMERALAIHDFEKARVYSDQDKIARQDLVALRQKHGLLGSSSSPI